MTMPVGTLGYKGDSEKVSRSDMQFVLFSWASCWYPVCLINMIITSDINDEWEMIVCFCLKNNQKPEQL